MRRSDDRSAAFYGGQVIALSERRAEIGQIAVPWGRPGDGPAPYGLDSGPLGERREVRLEPTMKNAERQIDTYNAAVKGFVKFKFVL
ncbi:MAG: hypothetical protein AAGF30_15640 [Pseudomonadota bacterium]